MSHVLVLTVRYHYATDDHNSESITMILRKVIIFCVETDVQSGFLNLAFAFSRGNLMHDLFATYSVS
jgi:hypothetical protein